MSQTDAPGPALGALLRTGSLRNAVVAGLWTLGSDAGGKIITLGASLVVARVLSPPEFGLYVALVALALVTGLMWDAGLSTLALRSVGSGMLAPGDAVRQGVRLRAFALPIWLVATVGAGALVAGGIDPLALSAPVLIASTAISLQALAIGAGRGNLQFRATGLAVVTGRLVVLITTGAVATGGVAAISVPTFLWCVAVGEVATLAMALAVLGEPRAPSVGRERLTYRRALPYAANTFLAYAYNRLDVLIVGALAGPAALAAYAPASRLQDAMLALPGAVATVLTPTVARWTATGRRGTIGLIRRTAIVGFVAGAVISACLWLIMPFLVPWLLGPAYEAAVVPARILVWFLPFAMVTGSVLGFLVGSGRGSAATLLFAVSFVVAIGLNLVLTWWAGAIGAAIASLARDPATTVVAWRLLHDPRGNVSRHEPLAP